MSLADRVALGIALVLFVLIFTIMAINGLLRNQPRYDAIYDPESEE